MTGKTAAEKREEDPTNSNRRKLLVAGLGAPFAAFGQPIPGPRIAWVAMASKSAGAQFLGPFVEGMAALGYVPGRNITLEQFWGENSRETVERVARDAAALNPALFVSQGPALGALRKLPGHTPVIFGNSSDPVESGIAQSIARPGGRFTGVSFLAYALVGKRVELVHQVAPKARRLAVLSNSAHRGDAKEFQATREAAAGLGLQVAHFPATNPAEVDRALAAIGAARSEALVVHPDGLMVESRGAIASFALAQRIPCVSGWSILAEVGSLMTYGPVLPESYRRLAYFVDRVLRGAKPAEMPIEMPSVFELVVNLKTARALGIAIPAAILVRADRVIG